MGTPGYLTQGCWVRSKYATSVLCSSPPPLQGKIFNLTILSRPASFCHNYEYPKLPARPSSETAFTLDEKCQNFINSSNFNDDGKRNVDSVDAATRRVSATSSASAAASAANPPSLESVSFEGPVSRKSMTSNSAMMPLYDVPRLLEEVCYDVPPKPVPVNIH